MSFSIRTCRIYYLW